MIFMLLNQLVTQTWAVLMIAHHHFLHFKNARQIDSDLPVLKLEDGDLGDLMPRQAFTETT